MVKIVNKFSLLCRKLSFVLSRDWWQFFQFTEGKWQTINRVAYFYLVNYGRFLLTPNFDVYGAIRTNFISFADEISKSRSRNEFQSETFSCAYYYAKPFIVSIFYVRRAINIVFFVVSKCIYSCFVMFNTCIMYFCLFLTLKTTKKNKNDITKEFLLHFMLIFHDFNSWQHMSMRFMVNVCMMMVVCGLHGILLITYDIITTQLCGHQPSSLWHFCLSNGMKCP